MSEIDLRKCVVHESGVPGTYEVHLPNGEWLTMLDPLPPDVEVRPSPYNQIPGLQEQALQLRPPVSSREKIPDFGEPKKFL